MEREIKAERAAAGREAAKARGKSGGRPRTDSDKLEQAKVLYENTDKSAAEVCQLFGFSRRTLFNYLSSQSKQAAFTLIELSIVLVIIGLIVGGVLVGQDLIRAAELRAIISDVDQFKTAANTFRLKYNCLPGDCPNATDFFGTDSNCTTGGGAGTCNGNNNKQIRLQDEGFRSWEHLALAGLIEGDFTGEPGPDSSYDHVVSTNVPGSSIKGAGYWFAWRIDNSSWAKFYNKFHGNHIVLGTESGGLGYFYDGAISGIDAFSIDSKVDDGMGGTGSVMSNRGYGCTNAANANDFTATYVTTSSVKNCFMVWPKVF